MRLGIAVMKRERISFEDFKKHFIDQPDGYFAVYSSFKEDYHGENLRVLQLDMICEWRLDDGKVKFVEVPFDTENEFIMLRQYLVLTAGMLNKAILGRLEELSYSETKPESEAIPYPPSSLPTLPDEKLEEIRKRGMQYEMSLIAEALREQAAGV